jgi:hypothetical protein
VHATSSALAAAEPSISRPREAPTCTVVLMLTLCARIWRTTERRFFEDDLFMISLITDE